MRDSRVQELGTVEHGTFPEAFALGFFRLTWRVQQDRCHGTSVVRLGDRARPFKPNMAKSGVGQLRNLSVSHVQADGADGIGCSITGLPEHPAEDISLEDVRLMFVGGGKDQDAQRDVPENPDRYPEYSMLGSLPAYGLYCRPVKRVQFQGVRVGWVSPDARPSLVCDDVEDVDLFGWHAAAASGAQPIVCFRNVRRALVHGCRSPEGTETFLRVEGKASSKIGLVANDLREARRAVDLGPEVAPDAVVKKEG